jgi:vitellogenic carboxypeptidase-like protein
MKYLCILALVLGVVAAGPLNGQFASEAERVNADVGDPLFITPYLDAGKIEEAQERSKVEGLWPGPTMHAGFLTTDKNCGSNMFMWVSPALNGDANAPVLLWLQGGPGGPSTFGMVEEVGPVISQPGAKWKPFTNSWNSKYTILAIDNPVGTGYSFTSSESCYSHNEDEVADNLYEALVQFYTLFPSYQKNEFYVTGESYAGHYIPAIAHRIHVENGKSPKVVVPLAGFACGDGWTDPVIQVAGYADLLTGIALVDDTQAKRVRQYQDAAVSAINAGDYEAAYNHWNEFMNGDGPTGASYFFNVTGLANYYDFTKTQSDPYYFDELVTAPATRLALHVGNTTMGDGSLVEQALVKDVMFSMKPLLPVLFENYKCLMYNGQLDIIVAPLLTEMYLRTVPWTGAAAYEAADRVVWKVDDADDEVAGYVRQAKTTNGELLQIVVRNAGHILPPMQPRAALDMLDRFIENRPFTN